MKIILSQRFWVYLWIIILSGVLGFYLRQPILSACSQGMILTLFVTLLSHSISITGITVTRGNRTKYALDEEQIEIPLLVRNKSLFPFIYLKIEDVFSPDRAKRKKILIPALPPFSTRLVSYNAICERGRGNYTLGPIHIVVSDPLGLFQIRRILKKEKDENILVFPKIVPLSYLPWEAKEGTRWLSVESHPLHGSSTNFYGTREYQPGDNLRHIHWLSSARREKLILKEFERDSNTDVILFLDLQRSRLVGWGKASNLELAIRLAASLAAYALRKGSALSFYADDSNKWLHIPMGMGEGHLIRILEILALVRGQGTTPLVDFIPKCLPSLSQGGSAWLIFLSILDSPESILNSLYVLSSKGIQAFPIFIDHTSFPALDHFHRVGMDENKFFSHLEKAGFPYRKISYKSDIDMDLKAQSIFQKLNKSK